MPNPDADYEDRFSSDPVIEQYKGAQDQNDTFQLIGEKKIAEKRAAQRKRAQVLFMGDSLEDK